MSVVDYALAFGLVFDASIVGIVVWHKLGGWAALVEWFRKKAG